jgi:uncharacterized PurR-regulated membrane protein YhhQ (DUF165 family)
MCWETLSLKYMVGVYKVKLEGRFFWLRSIVATLISEFILIFITVIIAFTPEIHLKETIHVFWDAYKLEILYALIFSIPAQMLVYFLKKAEGIDVYDYGISYNPFKFI